jgi:Na+-translocating ferredoxin:NAD+ oxidoreductase subunit G
MKKLESSLANMVIVLTVITVVAGAALAYVNHATSSQIEKIKADNLAKGIKQVMGVDLNSDFQYETDTVDTYIFYKSDKGTAIQSTTNGFGGPLTVLVGFDPEGTVLGYTILEHSETPGLGAKAGEWFQKGNRGDIIGKNPGEVKFGVTKGGEGDIDAITASTITSRAFLLAVQNAYDQLTNGNTNANTGASQQANASAATKEGGNNE